MTSLSPSGSLSAFVISRKMIPFFGKSGTLLIYSSMLFIATSASRKVLNGFNISAEAIICYMKRGREKTTFPFSLHISTLPVPEEEASSDARRREHAYPQQDRTREIEIIFLNLELIILKEPVSPYTLSLSSRYPVQAPVQSHPY